MRSNRKNSSRFQKVGGFSLVELSVVVAIMAVVAVFGLEAAANFVNRSSGTLTKERLATLDDAMVRFFRIYGRLPCPAQIGYNATTANYGLGPNGVPTSASYGIEDCTIAVFATDAEYTSQIGGGLMRGAVPFRTLNLPMSYSLDGFTNKINYVVTKNLTIAGVRASSFGYSAGTATTNGVAGIEIRSGVLEQPCNSARCQILAAPSATPSNGAAYILFSNGLDTRGAYSARGTLQKPCRPGTPSNAAFETRVDTQNCQYGTAAGAHTALTSTGNKDIPKNVFYDSRFNNGLNLTSYFDDYVVWRTKASLW